MNLPECCITEKPTLIRENEDNLMIWQLLCWHADRGEEPYGEIAERFFERCLKLDTGGETR